MTQRVGLPAICLKSFHLPLEAPPEVIAAAAETVKKAGVDLYGCGVVTMRDEAQVNQVFDYAKAAGMVRIMAAPAPEMLPLINQKVKQYNIQICIHNHGPGDKTFPTPDVAYQAHQGIGPAYRVLPRRRPHGALRGRHDCDDGAVFRPALRRAYQGRDGRHERR